MTDSTQGSVCAASRGVILIGTGVCLALTFVFLLLGEQLAADLSLRGVCVVATAAAVIVCSVLVMSSPRGMFSLGGIYAVTFAVFHFGLAAVFALGLDPVQGSTGPSSLSWFFDPATRFALIMSVTGIAGLGTGLCFQALLDRRAEHGRGEAQGFPYSFAGFLLLAVSLAAWLATVVSMGGFSVLVGSYIGFLEVTRGSALPLTYFGIGLGMALMAVGRTSPWRRVGLALFGMWALIAFPLGLRGEVLFPLAGALAMASMRRAPFGHGRLLLIGVGLLAVIAVVRVLRQVGIAGGVEGIDVSANPLNSLVELGSSLRPVTEVVRWAGDGEPALMGASFWAPFERLLQHLVPLWERAPSLDDQRLMNVLVAQRVGAIGFSPVAEAYHNFRAMGPAGVMFLIGNLLGLLDRRSAFGRNQAVAALIFVPLLIEIRNAFSHVPGQILAGAVTLGGMLFAHWAWRMVIRRQVDFSA